MSGKMNCAQARAIDLVEYLHGLGYLPQKISGKEWWYLSPLRSEKHPSFKVDRTRNIWYDHGLGKGGTLIDFGLEFYHCSLPDLLRILGKTKAQSFPFHSPDLLAHNACSEKEIRLEIVRSEPLQNQLLQSYVLRRGISLGIAKKYLGQITYRLVGKKEFLALGLRNNRGGYELRNDGFKGSSSPKDSTLIQEEKNVDTLSVFEGMFSFLSYLELKEKELVFQQKIDCDFVPVFDKNVSHFLILNSLSFLEKRRETMDPYPKINLYLDRDRAGLHATEKALQWSANYRDRSALYKGHKDLNEYLVHHLQQGLPHEKKNSQRWKRSF